MSPWEQRLADYQAMGAQARAALALLPQILLMSFVPAALGSMATWQAFNAIPRWLAIVGGFVTLAVAIASAIATLRQSSAAWGAARVRGQIESALTAANPALLTPQDRRETRDLIGRQRASNWYYVPYLVQVIFSVFLLIKIL
jgi:hypothetical protein